MFNTVTKKLQQQYYSQTWQQSLKNKQMIKNSYHAHGDIKRAKAFVQSVATYTPHTHFAEHGEHIIFSSDMLLAPAYTM